MANIQISSPFLRGFIHSNSTVGTTDSVVLSAAVTPERRISVIIQNQDAVATITVIFADSGIDGFKVNAGESISLDNYNGVIRCISSAANTVVHIAYATA